MHKKSLSVRALISMGLVALCAGLISATPAAAAGSSAGPKIGTQAIKTSFYDVNRRRYALRPTNGRPALFLFLSTECPVANVYTPRILALEKTCRRQGVALFGVYANGYETATAIKQHAAQRGFEFPIIQDDGTLAARLGAMMTPEAVLLDGRGVIRYRGRIDDHRNPEQVRSRDLQVALDAVLAGKPVARAETPAFGCPLSAPAKPRSAPLQTVTFTRDVAPILNKNCVECHRAGEVAPFALENYKQAARWAQQIKTYTASRKMPPWKADSRGEFHDERRLTEKEIGTLAAWVDAGAPEGDPKDLPKPPRFRSGWKLGEPDAIIEMPETYQIGPDGKDIYQCFVIPTTYDEDRWIAAVEVHPGNRRVVHHVIAYLDTMGQGRKLDAADPGPGYTNPTPGSGPGFLSAGMLAGWAPGNQARFLPEGVGNRLPKGADIVMEVHYHKNGQTEQDRTKIGLYFAKGPVKKRVGIDMLINFSFRIPPGDSNHTVTAQKTLSEDITLLGVTPHMHQIGRTMKVTATLPDKTTRQLVHVYDWDFNWQYGYNFKEPLKLPKGTVLNMVATFDNSEQNPNNPNRPPKPITWGESTTDEMCIAFLTFTRDAEDLTKEVARK